MASKTEMARRWNHQTVLENHSLYQCLEMLRTPGLDALTDTRANRDAIIAMIIKIVRLASCCLNCNLQQLFATRAQNRSVGRAVLCFADASSSVQVLGTDMTNHFSIMGDFKVKVRA